MAKDVTVAKAQTSAVPATFDPKAQYRITLSKIAHHGSSIMRPKDSHIVSGAEVKNIVPADAIAGAEKV